MTLSGANKSSDRAVGKNQEHSVSDLSAEVSVLDVSALRFYRSLSRKSITANLVLSGLCLALGAAIYVLKTNETKREYFAYDSRTGKMVQMVPLSRPNMSRNALLNWTMSCVERANSWDVVNYRKQLTEAMDCFTSEGWNQFYAALEESGNLAYAIDKKMIATAVRNGPAVVFQEGVNPVNGSYSYIIQFPMTISYQGEGRLPTQQQVMTVQVTRVDPEMSPDGVGIEQIVGE